MADSSPLTPLGPIQVDPGTCPAIVNGTPWQRPAPAGNPTVPPPTTGPQNP
jgi:hypothetical protein